MVRGLVPAACRAQNPGRLEPGCHGRGHPDVVEPPAAVGGGPVARPVAPPAIKPFRRGGEVADGVDPAVRGLRSEEHTSELQSLMRISYAVFCLQKKNRKRQNTKHKGAYV